MRTLTIHLPPGLNPDRARLLLAIRLYEEGDVSLGYAAAMARHSVPAFTELLSERGIPAVADPEHTLDRTLAAGDALDEQNVAR